MNHRIKSASLTVEAALVLPIFLFAMLTILYFNRMLLLEEKVQWALVRTGREVSVEYAVSEKKMSVNPVLLTGKMNLYLEGEPSGVSMLRSQFDEESGELNLIADYSVQIPFPFFSGKVFPFTEQYRTRVFVGVRTRQSEETGSDETVYITEFGRVFHKDLSCTYLELSISQVKYKDLEYLRSDSGAKYYACEGCSQGKGFTPESDVLICNYGNRFHINRSCSKLKRNIREILLSQVGDRVPCSKCGKE